ncbi:LysR family transcriptional regulator [Amycolatopsis sp., V23-08]|uniref:LysR family transcriptional regulator n=1 Tax=Amycolatopsis heterodermiae TaxID=3110235 RepID=A0ABU5RC62_9PSEU|nr:LysR family transcriptional regulator [Amycolatopsis sp., V23-08]MEA5363840.1 LysR family transcriptional regulator [Amycolatopsis sp., V23-08]
MDRLETRELAYFVAVAEELHFGRAAERLGIAAPPLSRAIARLERRLDVRLFDRTSRRVSLTDAGRVFLADSRSALAAVDRAARRVGRSSRLTVAVRSGTAAGVLAELVDAHPVELLFTTDQVGAVRGGAADVALLCASNDLAGFVTTDVAEELPVALVPVSHPLAGRTTVSIADLRREDAFRPECPQLPLDEIVDRVAVGELLAVVGHGAVSRAGDTVVGVPVADCPPTRVVLARLAGTPTAEVKTFERTAKDLAARRLAMAATA